jgi:hypothetical protein
MFEFFHAFFGGRPALVGAFRNICPVGKCSGGRELSWFPAPALAATVPVAGDVVAEKKNQIAPDASTFDGRNPS